MLWTFSVFKLVSITFTKGHNRIPLVIVSDTELPPSIDKSIRWFRKRLIHFAKSQNLMLQQSDSFNHHRTNHLFLNTLGPINQLFTLNYLKLT